MDPAILGAILGYPIFGNSQIMGNVFRAKTNRFSQYPWFDDRKPVKPSVLVVSHFGVESM